MRGDGLAGPDGAGFFRGVVANGEDEVHFWRAGLGEFVPILAAEGRGGKMGRFKLAEGFGANRSRGVAAGAVGSESGAAFMIEDCLGHDGAGGISGAQEERVVGAMHGVHPFGWEAEKIQVTCNRTGRSKSPTVSRR